MLFFGKLDAARGWTKQLHLGALRSVNTRALKEIGPDTGYDNIGDWNQAEPLSKYLNLLEHENALPKMVLYNVNPVDNYVLATVTGSFPGRKHCRQNSVWQRLVVSRSEGSHRVAA